VEMACCCCFRLPRLQLLLAPAVPLATSSQLLPAITLLLLQGLLLLAAPSIERHRDRVGDWRDACLGHGLVDVRAKMLHIHVSVLHGAEGRRRQERRQKGRQVGG